jgi:hypothetical protein
MEYLQVNVFKSLLLGREPRPLSLKDIRNKKCKIKNVKCKDRT